MALPRSLTSVTVAGSTVRLCMWRRWDRLPGYCPGCTGTWSVDCCESSGRRVDTRRDPWHPPRELSRFPRSREKDRRLREEWKKASYSVWKIDGPTLNVKLFVVLISYLLCTTGSFRSSSRRSTGWCCVPWACIRPCTRTCRPCRGRASGPPPSRSEGLQVVRCIWLKKKGRRKKYVRNLMATILSALACIFSGEINFRFAEEWS